MDVHYMRINIIPSNFFKTYFRINTIILNVDFFKTTRSVV